VPTLTSAGRQPAAWLFATVWLAAAVALVVTSRGYPLDDAMLGAV
jgi:hypothetical protein